MNSKTGQAWHLGKARCNGMVCNCMGLHQRYYGSFGYAVTVRRCILSLTGLNEEDPVGACEDNI